MRTSDRITKSELLDAAALKLAQMAMSDAGVSGFSSAAEEEPTNGKKRRRKASKKLTPSRSVSAQQILGLIRSKGPLRGIEIMEATGLSSGAVRMKVNELKKEKAVTEVKDGTIVRFAPTRGAGSARKSSLKAGRKKTRRSAKKKRASKKTPATEAAA